MNNIFDTISELLLINEKYVSEDKKLLKTKVINDAINFEEDLLKLLLSNAEIEREFFKNINGTKVFNQQKFVWLINSKEFLPDSYTRYSNKIGLTHNDYFLSRNNDIVLSFPFKDCYLAGGQDKDDQKSNEILFNEIIASNQITTMLSPKVFTNAIRYSAVKNGEIYEIKEDQGALEFTDSDNLLIKGNNLLALASILKRFENKVKCIYIDPPYNTGNDSFNYNDSFNHSTWLTFMKNRLELAKRLLRDDGVIFVQCDDNEQAYLKVLMDEIFGRENFVSNLVWLKGNAQNDAKTIQRNHEYILSYATNIESCPILKTQQSIKVKAFKDEKTNKYYYEGAGLTTGGAGGTLSERPNLGFTIYYNPTLDDFFAKDDYDKNLAVSCNDENLVYKTDENLVSKGYLIIRPPKKGSQLGRWTWELAKFNDNKDRILIKETSNGYRLSKKEWLSDNLINIDENGEYYANLEKESPPKSFIDFVSSGMGTKEQKKLFDNKVFNNPKPESIITYLLEISTLKEDIILDFFAGSGTTCAVAHKMGRKYIGIEQMNYIENITVERMKKVLLNEQGGISRSLNWKGGGSFIYCELKEDSITLLDEVHNATIKNVNTIKEKIYSDERLVPYLTKKELEELDQIFESMSLKEKKEALSVLINKNKLYVNLSDIEDISYEINDKDKSFTYSFYK